MVAGLFRIPEVLIVIQELILRGNRCVFRNPQSFDLVQSQHFPPIGRLSTSIDINWQAIFPY